MISGFLLVLTASFLRLGAGLLVFVLLARILGPAEFGVFALWLAVATLATIPVNFGFGTAALRLFGVEPQRKQAVMSAVLTAKLLLALPVLAGALIAWLWLPSSVWLVFIALLLAQLADSLAELYGLGFRAASNYAAEARVASAVSLLHILVMLGTVAVSASVLAAALAFLASRALGLAFMRWRSERAFQRIPLASVAEARALVRRSWAYAAELALSTAYTQLDSVLIGLALGTRAVGLYQAGMKLVQGFSRLAPILAQYVLPKLSAHLGGSQHGQGPGQMAYALFTVLLFSAVGMVIGGGLALFAQPISLRLFGPDFVALTDLLPLFGCLLLLRFTETGCGLVLVASGWQSRKVWLVAAQLAAMLLIGWFALSMGGLRAWLLTSIACTVALLCAYVALWLRSVSTRRAL